MGTFGDLFLGPHLPPQSLPLCLIHDHRLLSPGLVTSDKESAAHIINKKDDDNLLGVLIGGAQEALNARPGTCTLLLGNCKGFIRFTLMHGYLGRGLWVHLEIGENCSLVGRQQRLNGDSSLAERSSVHSQYQRYFGEQCTISCPNTQERSQRGDLVIKGTRREGIYCPKLTLDPTPVRSGIMEFEAYCRAVL